MLSSQGQEAVKFGIPNDFINRKKSLAEGEAALMNTKTGTWVLMKDDGTIELSANSKILGNLDVIGNITATGTIVGSSTITGAGLVSTAGVVSTGTLQGSDLVVPGSPNYSTHVHGGVQPGIGVSGGPQ
jgi:hypothetical protein